MKLYNQNTIPGGQVAINSGFIATALFVGLTYGLLPVIMVASLLSLDSRVLTIPFRGVSIAFAAYLILKHGAAIVRLAMASRSAFAFVVFWCCYGLRLLNDLYISPPVAMRLQKSEYVMYALGVCLIPALAFAIPITKTAMDKIFRRLAWYVVLLAACALFLFRNIFGQNFNRIGMTPSDVSIGPLGIGYFASSLISMAILYLFVAERRKLSSIGLVAALLLTGLPLLALSASRGPVVVIAVVTLIMIIARSRPGSALWPLLLGLTILLLTPFIADTMTEIGSSISERFGVLMSADSIAENARTTLWMDAISQFLESPFTGSGIDEKFSLFYPHNLVVEAFMATGIVGGSAMVTFLLGSVAASFRILSSASLSQECGWVAVLFLNFAGQSMFTGAIYTNVLFWGFGLAVLSIDCTRRAVKNNSLRRSTVKIPF